MPVNNAQILATLGIDIVTQGAAQVVSDVNRAEAALAKLEAAKGRLFATDQKLHTQGEKLLRQHEAERKAFYDAYNRTKKINVAEEERISDRGMMLEDNQQRLRDVATEEARLEAQRARTHGMQKNRIREIDRLADSVDAKAIRRMKSGGGMFTAAQTAGMSHGQVALAANALVDRVRRDFGQTSKEFAKVTGAMSPMERAARIGTQMAGVHGDEWRRVAAPIKEVAREAPKAARSVTALDRALAGTTSSAADLGRALTENLAAMRGVGDEERKQSAHRQNEGRRADESHAQRMRRLHGLLGREATMMKDRARRILADNTAQVRSMRDLGNAARANDSIFRASAGGFDAYANSLGRATATTGFSRSSLGTALVPFTEGAVARRTGLVPSPRLLTDGRGGPPGFQLLTDQRGPRLITDQSNAFRQAASSADGYGAALGRTGSEGTRALGRITNAFAAAKVQGDGFLGVLLQITAVYAALSGVAAGVSTLARFEDITDSFSALHGGNQFRGERDFAFARSLARTTPQTIEDVSTAMLAFRNADIEPTESLMRLLADVSSASINSTEGYKAAAKILRRRRGGLGIEELEILETQGIDVYGAIERQLGLGRLDIGRLGQTKEGATRITDALIRDWTEKYGGASARRLDNLSVKANAFMDTMKEAAVAVGGPNGLGRTLHNALSDVTSYVQSSTPALERFGKSLKVIADVARSLATATASFNEATGGSLFKFIGLGGIMLAASGLWKVIRIIQPFSFMMRGMSALGAGALGLAGARRGLLRADTSGLILGRGESSAGGRKRFFQRMFEEGASWSSARRHLPDDFMIPGWRGSLRDHVGTTTAFNPESGKVVGVAAHAREAMRLGGANQTAQNWILGLGLAAAHVGSMYQTAREMLGRNLPRGVERAVVRGFSLLRGARALAHPVTAAGVGAVGALGVARARHDLNKFRDSGLTLGEWWEIKGKRIFDDIGSLLVPWTSAIDNITTLVGTVLGGIADFLVRVDKTAQNLGLYTYIPPGGATHTEQQLHPSQRGRGRPAGALGHRWTVLVPDPQDMTSGDSRKPGITIDDVLQAMGMSPDQWFLNELAAVRYELENEDPNNKGFLRRGPSSRATSQGFRAHRSAPARLQRRIDFFDTKQGLETKRLGLSASEAIRKRKEEDAAYNESRAEEFQRQMDAQKDAIESLRELNAATRDFSDTTRGAWSTMVEATRSGSLEFKEAFNDFFDELGRDLHERWLDFYVGNPIKAFIDSLISDIFTALTNPRHFTQGAGGNLLGNAFGAFTGALGGGPGHTVQGVLGAGGTAGGVSVWNANSFSGGGYTGSGARIGGVDGRGGFPAILHPRESVIDHEGGAGIRIPVTVNNNASGARASVGPSADGRGLAIQVENIMANAVRNGGSFKKQMQQEFVLQSRV